MNPILLAVLIVSGIGLLLGAFLVLANRFFAVEEDETVKELCAILPGANCGACGFSGCSGYAAALAENKQTETTRCPVGGNETAQKIAALLGVAAGEVAVKKARVRCQGFYDAKGKKSIYEGISSCHAATMLYGGDSACIYGCLGYGDCVGACDKQAISICGGVALVTPSLCKGCGKCVTACPKHITEMVSEKESAYVPCSNKDKGAQTKKVCQTGCLGCKMCAKVCEAGAIRFEGGLAVIDDSLCTGCGKCIAACKFGVIKSYSPFA